MIKLLLTYPPEYDSLLFWATLYNRYGMVRGGDGAMELKEEVRPRSQLMTPTRVYIVSMK